MSLVLEALRKIEREKQTPDRGFLVMGPGGWPPRRSKKWMGWALGFLLVVVAGVALGRFLVSRGSASLPPSGSPAPSSSNAVQLVTPPVPVAGDPPALAPSPAPTSPDPRAAHDRPVRLAVPPPSPARSPQTAPPLVLTAISRQDGRAVAVLNDHLVREGDSFDGIRVLRIGEAEIEVEVAGRRVVVSF